MANNKSAFLGMPHGTASNRLKKIILFSLVQETHKDSCYRCGKKIKTAEELSIEHIEPWENRSTELFWDLNNIVFSHRTCNRPHYESLRSSSPNGKEWCYKCKNYINKDKFCISKRDGKAYWSCKPCSNTLNRKRYHLAKSRNKNVIS